MASRYRTIADDLRSRIASGEWSVGETLPTIAQLQDQYDGVALNTVRTAQQVLVDEGVLETVAGRGAFVRRVPATDTGQAVAVRQLVIVRDAAADALRALTAHPGAPMHESAALVDQDAHSALAQSWGYMQHWHCRTCGQDLRGITRGWVEAPDHLDLYAEIGHNGHDVATYFGIDADAQDLALRKEHWWERRAHLERAGELLLAGDQRAATAYAQRAQQLLTDDPGLDDLGVELIPPPGAPRR